MSVFLVVVCLLLAAALHQVWRRWRRLARERFIREYPFPVGLMDRLERRRPGMPLKDRVLVSRGLRQFFLAHLKSGCKFVSMPSQVADDLWHEFILYTRQYQEFCRRAFGGFFHHTPAVVLSAERSNNAGLRRTWWYACREENIDPRRPTRLPLLFALDGKLGVADGFTYEVDCARQRAKGSAVYCGGDFSSSSYDGGIDGFGDVAGADAGGDAGSGDGGGCGGGGCGGGGGD